MNRRVLYLTGLLTLLVILMVSHSCIKEKEVWDPEVRLVIAPDSGLTTQVFDFGLEVLNLPSSHQSLFVRWDLNGDSLWDVPYSAEQVIKHRFYQAGIHHVRVELLTEDGQTRLITRDIRVEQGYSAPHVELTIEPPIGHYRTEFTFDASQTFDDEDPFESLEFRWDFENDGVWDTDWGHEPMVSHRYPSAGDYTVRVSVVDPTRRTASLTSAVEVNRHDPLILADFSWTPDEATVKDTFLLDASATRHSMDSIRTYRYTWDIKNEQRYGPFDDPRFEHVFWFFGPQEITLTATDQYGLSNSITKGFYVIKENKPPVAGIQLATQYGNIQTNFYISAWPSRDDVTMPSELLVRWDFEGDGIWDTGWSTEKLVFHQYSTPGTYWVTLEAEDEGGERATTREKLHVSSSTAPTGYILDARDGHYYGTVKIGHQWWMSDNLDYRTPWKIIEYIPMVQKCYDEEVGNCDRYGSLYQGDRTISYDEAGHQICPTGWRLPAKADWETMASYAPSGEGSDAFMIGGSLGFNAQLTGYGYYAYLISENPPIIYDTIWSYYGVNQEVKFFSATRRPHMPTEQAQFHFGLVAGHPDPILSWSNHRYYYYIRCVKDEY